MSKVVVAPPEERPVHYYDQIYQSGYEVDHMWTVYGAVLAILQSLKQPVQVLEVGCGLGHFGEMAVSAGFKYRGFDFSIEAIRRCPGSIRSFVSRRNAYHRSTFRVGHTVVVAIEVMEHLRDLEVVDMIAPDTVCIFTLPNYTDAAHLRTYDSEKAIRKYYKGLIRWHKIQPIEMAADAGIKCGKKIIWVCKGVKV
jgi:2-polyprenyl-3-methyl-5-hydroxy-6-metoxy-1,4-benzoquinol methylase